MTSQAKGEKFRSSLLETSESSFWSKWKSSDTLPDKENASSSETDDSEISRESSETLDESSQEEGRPRPAFGSFSSASTPKASIEKAAHNSSSTAVTPNVVTNENTKKPSGMTLIDGWYDIWRSVFNSFINKAAIFNFNIL